jgi:hypothetical protein
MKEILLNSCEGCPIAVECMLIDGVNDTISESRIELSQHLMGQREDLEQAAIADALGILSGDITAEESEQTGERVARHWTNMFGYEPGTELPAAIAEVDKVLDESSNIRMALGSVAGALEIEGPDCSGPKSTMRDVVGHRLQIIKTKRQFAHSPAFRDELLETIERDFDRKRKYPYAGVDQCASRTVKKEFRKVETAVEGSHLQETRPKI